MTDVQPEGRPVQVVSLTMPAKSDYLILARLALAGIARAVSIEESALADLKLAVTEACGNVVQHAYSTGAGTVRLHFRIEGEEVEITVEDEGDRFEVSAPDTDRDLSQDELADSGMGLAIIRAVVDTLEVENRANGGGTVVRMRKSLATA